MIPDTDLIAYYQLEHKQYNTYTLHWCQEHFYSVLYFKNLSVSV